ncbi:aspartyl/glutamyl-tRNA(Asn/Gln) amidotransferase subunit C [Hydrogenispora ethanolica]|jgi:aspartyl-tRNA(Asn)/glutamyl-tRNA(Gln) amidotransferase subunit C|uniref:Aspartyl/glutamyl-tRNA(Asn/Gln) amidotransferase subunit C n=1 Tax=Hydrogenispora ethanolica TaxID=1082276 RepID=A0A4R1RTV3_HYDET|nr:Asp-tRNA(Asn)/Glu-tRNA(Gln) amidotransferase subunit GatC [Hydrogenispora ethanolica]TCL69985.1 aspartyl/glutamyl-tRNA(Asn/Gln) amidotransferase subunit C [Hydrogenispora ethanolica]
MRLTKTEVEHVARLARLELSEAEKEEFTGQLNEILNFVEELNQLDTQGIEPTAHAIPVTNVFRSDRVEPSLDPELALANAPDRIDNFFKVPKVLED